MRNVFTYFMLFFIYAILGWIIETTLVSIEKRKFVNRGFLIGPYCPIYGFGGLAITILLKNYTKDPIVLFLMAVIICGTLEYFTSYIMEKIFKARWWDYSNKKFNINGRICLEYAMLFGIGGTLIMYFINPMIINVMDTTSSTVIKVLAITLFIIYIVDNIISYIVMFKFRSTVGKLTKGDNTEEITKIIKDKFKSLSWLNKRLTEAFPNLKAYTKKIKQLKK